ncbi:T4 beta protein [Azospirillum brasilense]|uniref:T4 beta protein n=1 Tax=Azospirillum brasilense TaxID=192 RepID=A0A560BV98_AZOBR|nr:hypothetical protein [Azospirillum brasilense]TWA76409.1 T4 beta protein [Azospirillum brasilense]
MPPWESNCRRYFPIIHVLQADLKGFSQLPASDGERLCPIIPLAQANGAHRFDNTLRKVREAISGKSNRFIADLADDLGQSLPIGDMKDVHRDLQRLASSANSYAEWRKFICENEDMVPTIRIGAATADHELDAQVDDFLKLERGIVIRYRPRRQGAIIPKIQHVIRRIAREKALGSLLIVVDLEDIRESLTPSAVAEAIITDCAVAAGGHEIIAATAATSFPTGFNGVATEVNEYPIVERQLNNSVASTMRDSNVRVLYSDYASARIRVKEQRGGTGYPRIDYAVKSSWYSNRQKDGLDGADGYKAAAESIIDCDGWIEELDIYGANMIREASEGVLEKRAYAKFWVGVRINLHLHAQARYHDSSEELIEAAKEDDWDD